MLTLTVCLLSLLQIRTRGAEIALCSVTDWQSHVRPPLTIANALGERQHHVTFVGPESSRQLVEKHPQVDMRSIGDLDQSWRYLEYLDDLAKGHINLFDVMLNCMFPGHS